MTLFDDFSQRTNHPRIDTWTYFLPTDITSQELEMLVELLGESIDAGLIYGLIAYRASIPDPELFRRTAVILLAAYLGDKESNPSIHTAAAALATVQEFPIPDM